MTKINCVYFSPTGGTKTITKAIASAMAENRGRLREAEGNNVM